MKRLLHCAFEMLRLYREYRITLREAYDIASWQPDPDFCDSSMAPDFESTLVPRR